LNALRHGLTSQFPVIPGEDGELYQVHLQAFLDEYAPQSVSELHLVRSLADLAWRIDRIASMEAKLLWIPADQDEILDTVTLVKTRDVLMRAVSNLSLHGHRLRREFAKTRVELLEIQSQNQPREENKDENPLGFVFAESELSDSAPGDTTPDPEPDPAEVDTQIDPK
jgi:hypothetical protein